VRRVRNIGQIDENNVNHRYVYITTAPANICGVCVCLCAVMRSIYVDRNSSTVSLHISRSGYSHKLVIVTYVTQQLNHLPAAAAGDDEEEEEEEEDGGYTDAGVRIYRAIEGVDFSRAVSTSVLSADVVSVQHCMEHALVTWRF